jgi:phosphatidylglycerophosphate synthase
MAATPLVLRRGYRFEVNFLGKVATWIIYSSLCFVLVTADGTDWPLWLFWIGFATAIVSLVQYARKAGREVRPEQESAG